MSHFFHYDKKMNAEYKKIGQFTGTHGLNGMLSIHVLIEFVDFIQEQKFIFIEIKPQTYIPYRLLKVKKETKEDFLVSIKGFDNIDEAKKISLKSIALPVSAFSERQKTLHNPEHLSTFTILDHSTQIKLKIEKILATAGQVLAITQFKDKEVIVPMHESLIEDVDEKNQIIIMKLPEGLIDIYL